MSRSWSIAVHTGTALAIALAGHAFFNGRLLRTPRAAPPSEERISVMIPARDEADHVGVTVADLLASVNVPDLELLVLDDGSTDGTPAVLASFSDPRLEIIQGPDERPPSGWLGKPWACHRLAQRASGNVLVFADADVRFQPSALAAAVAALRAGRFGMVSPTPRQLAVTWPERLVQPLLPWSWLSTMPLRWSEKSLRPTLASANGQFLVFDTAAYWAAGGHAAVRDQVLEDIALMRQMKRSGRYTATLDASQLAATRMYSNAREILDGYSKSLWSAFGGPVGTVGVVSVLVVSYVVPAAAAVVGPTRRLRMVGATGYAAGVFGRVVTGRRMGDRVCPDAAAHPLSILALAALNAISWTRHRRGTNKWKGRTVTAPR